MSFLKDEMKKKDEAILEDMKQEIERGTMPLKPYVMMHAEAKLNEETKVAMIAWIDKKSDELMNQPEE